MTSKSCYNRERQAPATELRGLFLAALIFTAVLSNVPRAVAGDAPQWMHAVVNAPLPTYDEKTDAVLLYSETNVTVISTDKIRTQVREVYKVLRPKGRDRGTVVVYLNPEKKIKSLHGWCIPANGKDYEVKDKDAIERAPQNAEMIEDVKARILHIPAPDPGNIVGYEYEVEERPFFLQDQWDFQEPDPVRESHYSLQLPPGWEFKESWLNYPGVKAVDAGNNTWKWTVQDINGVRWEPEMPPFEGVVGQMIVTLFPAGGGPRNSLAGWNEMGKWYSDILKDRLEESEPLKHEVDSLTASKATTLQKMQAIAAFVQQDIRYFAVELGIGGWQPHPASEVFSHRYGDCKDKATLVRAMLHQIGVESYHVVINTERGSVTPASPAHHGFNHAILAVKLPEGVSDPSLTATLQDPKAGRILFFDPTDEMTPFGQIRGELQANYALLVLPDGGELIELPQQPSATNSIERTARLTLDPSGTLHGDVKETRLGDRAVQERWNLRTVTKDSDRIKPIESLLSGSLSSFRITKASVLNQTMTDKPFGFNYSFESDSYAKNAGNLLLVRPRVIGVKAVGFLETKEPRKFPIEFEGPVRDTDNFEIAIPAGYEVDDLPPPVDADYSFASYHSKTEVKGNVIGYTRTFEVKELHVPVDKADELKKFYRIIAGDERNTVVLKTAAK
jgi:hypothetical protein